MFTFSTQTRLKNTFIHTFMILLLVIFISSCSTKKNTWTTRSYQNLTTRFNVFFNGTVSYNEGLKNIQKANQDDYSSILPMYPISHHKNAAAATTDMDRTIEKSRKAIKLHSIKVKPERNFKKANQPEYKLFYNQQEFNPALKDVWMQLGKAEFHKGDFLGAAGTFSYVSRHYSGDKDMIAKCQLWIVRAYAEMGWIYEAEQVLSKIVQDDLKQSNIGLFASVNADLLLKKHQYKEAIPFLELALAKENDKVLKQRFTFLLAQLYRETNNNKAAYDAYTKVIKLNPAFEMDFNARISRTQLDNRNPVAVRKELSGMLKNQNNKEFLDQIYYALGNSYLQQSDTLKAVENFKLSIESSTRNGIDKAVTLIALGDLYYSQKNYVQSQPCYDEASKIISNEHDEYARVSRLAEMLGELVLQNDIVLLQDSLQRLAEMPESKRLEVVNKLIDKIFADEKLAEENALKEKEIARYNPDGDFANVPPIGMNPGGMGGWYFYNPELMRAGQAEFAKKWGRRKLEDNWRRGIKTTSLFADETQVANNVANNVAENADPSADPQQTVPLADNKKPEFYLRQIPVTPMQITSSNAEIANALFAMGHIYKDKIEDYPMAISTFEEFGRRFRNDVRVPDAYFNLYMIHTKLANQSDANLYRSKLITEFPDSKYQKILSQPDYAERMERMYREQDSIYNLTYIAYNKSDFATVYNHVEYIQKNYPLSSLMPKFLFLNALSIGKNESPEKFRAALDNLVTTYPESDVSAMSKDILALIKQGQEAKTGTTSGTLLTRREETTKIEIDEISTQKFTFDKQAKHRLMLISSASTDELNKLIYNLASFNFSRFMIKDFDLVINRLDSVKSALSVTNFESYDEAQWYLNSISTDDALTLLTNKLIENKVIISEDNYGLLRTVFSMDDYLLFQANQSAVKQVTIATVDKPARKNGVTPVMPVNKAKLSPVVALKSADEKSIIPEVKPVEKPIEKVDDKPVAEVKKTTDETKQTEQKTAVAPVVVTPVQPKVDDVPLFKNLFAYRANEPHFVAIYVVSGTFDFEKTKAAIDAYNAQNYSVLNLKVSLETFEKRQIIIIGSLNDAQIGKSYLLRMVKEKALFDGMKGSVYRNLLGSQQNLNTVLQQNALSTYFEFMQEYYLK
jgi:tetratricopeptide (TPR) repeat protein